MLDFHIHGLGEPAGESGAEDGGSEGEMGGRKRRDRQESDGGLKLTEATQ